jgi:hypothetical protein
VSSSGRRISIIAAMTSSDEETNVSKKADGIQREYLLRKLARMRAGRTIAEVVLLNELREWVKAQRTRSKRPGGLGK